MCCQSRVSDVVAMTTIAARSQHGGEPCAEQRCGRVDKRDCLRRQVEAKRETGRSAAMIADKTLRQRNRQRDQCAAIATLIRSMTSSAGVSPDGARNRRQPDDRPRCERKSEEKSAASAECRSAMPMPSSVSRCAGTVSGLSRPPTNASTLMPCRSKTPVPRPRSPRRPRAPQGGRPASAPGARTRCRRDAAIRWR